MAWTPPTARTTGELITASVWNTDLRDNLMFLKTPLDNAGNIAPPISTITIASATATPLLNRHFVATQGGIALDNLNTLTTANVRDGHITTLSAFNIAQVVSVNSQIGNINLTAGAFLLNSVTRSITLQLRSTTWYELSRSDQNFSIITAPYLVGYKELWQNPPIVSGVLTINALSGNHALVTLNANITNITVTNVPISGAVFMLIVYFTADGTLRTVNHTVNSHVVRFPGGVVPPMTSASGKVDKVVYWTLDGGATWFGDFAAQNY